MEGKDMKQIKWQEEFKLHMSFKSTFVIEGEILDKQPYLGDKELDLYPLDNYFEVVLREMGYQTIVHFDHVRNFYDYGKKDLNRLKDIVRKVKQQSSILVEKNKIQSFQKRQEPYVM